MMQNLFIIGATGKVGSALVRQIFEKKDTDSNIHANPTRIIGLASSEEYAFMPEGISRQQAYDFIEKRSGITQKYDDFNQLLKAADNGKDYDGNMLVFVDVTAVNKPMAKFHLKVIRETPYSIVTANKNPVALSDYGTFIELTKKLDRYGYRCSVMAGAESVAFLRDLKDVNDQPKFMQGCFSGTLGYVSSELEKGRKFSEIILEARDKGYTEPDPRDDLNGLDVARKMIVLARTAGFSAGLKDIKVDPFIPKGCFKDESIEEFLASIKVLDSEFGKRFSEAKKRGMTLRYVAQMDAAHGIPSLDVSLKEVSKESPLGSLKGTLNKIVVVSSTYPESSPYSVEAPGAGLEVTAQNIRRDLLYLIKEREVRIK